MNCPQIITRIEYALALCLIAYASATTLRHAWRILNTDFPNYYVTARLVQQHSSTSRIYEWIWFQRQKDYIGVDQPYVTMIPHTPFSTLMLLPLASLSPLSAKHGWIAFNLGLLAVFAWLLRRITGLPPSRILLLLAASYPMQRNFLNGQYYLLLAVLLAAGLFLCLRNQSLSAGLAVAIAICLKLFPLLFVVYFLRRRDWKALAGTSIGTAVACGVSLVAFGWQLHRLFFQQILPRSMAGESTGPYNLSSASFAVLFHRLFVFEPALNPHPVLHAYWLLPVLMGLVQLAVVAPLLLLIRASKPDSHCLQLEWSAVTLACLLLSPLPASYHFVLLLLPVAVLLRLAADEGSLAKLAVISLLFLGIGFPHWSVQSAGGWHPLLHLTRLYLLIAIYLYTLFQLAQRAGRTHILRPQNLAWATAIVFYTLITITIGVHAQRNFDDKYTGRLILDDKAYLLAQPQASANGLSYIAMQRMRFRAIPNLTPTPSDESPDELAQTNRAQTRWIEVAAQSSRLVSSKDPASPVLNAESPTLSPDGLTLAFLREDHGRASLWFHSLTSITPDTRITPPDLNVLESTFVTNDEVVFSVLGKGDTPTLYLLGRSTPLRTLGTDESRYPSSSPNGRWLAFSQLINGNWNLRLLERATGNISPITTSPCNDIEPTWEADSRTLAYASDCGRALFQTALYRRVVIP